MAGKKKEEKEKKEKPLENWTIKELREEALKSGEVQGVHGMNKEELLTEVRKAKGVPEPGKAKGQGVRELKAKVQELRQKRDEEREQGASKLRLTVLRKKIAKIKRLTKG
ncbi:MAG: transcription termination factor Rho [Desulfomonile tiedjei]|uniref:Transcription termination factor Rho n=1 Tax=Desulfomonile tiedjei TaxID=2358 RepID=A0A9D6Z5R4_9BACT|nr:transcription termination factor Rho [Desulfomonile tiedjei]